MSALLYLLRTRVKNTIKTLPKSPSRMILIIIVAAFLVFIVAIGGGGHQSGDGSPIEMLYAIVFALYFFIFFMVMFSGLGNGASFFAMQDVNLLFPAPVSNKKIMLYGLIRQLGTTMMMAVFIIYQYGWMSNVYGIGISDLLAIMLGYILTVFCAQLIAMGIYSFTAGNDRRRTIVRWIAYAFIALCAASLIPAFLSGEPILQALSFHIADSAGYSYIPVAGWMLTLVRGLMEASAVRILLGGGATVVFVAAFVAVLLKVNTDYYEDVLVAAEVSFSAITAQKEGRVAEIAPDRVKIGKVGIGRGEGPIVFFHKHMLENRRARVMIFDMMTLVFFAVTLIFGYFMREMGGIIPGLAFSVYMMLFSSFVGRWGKELLLPYVYMLPEPPFYKLIAICGEFIYKSLVESAVIVTALGLLVKAPVPVILAGILVRFSAALIFIAATVLTERLFGGVPSKVLQTFIYIMVLLLLIAPGVVVAVFVGFATGLVVALLSACAWMLLLSALVIFLCRNILATAELNNR